MICAPKINEGLVLLTAGLHVCLAVEVVLVGEIVETRIIASVQINWCRRETWVNCSKLKLANVQQNNTLRVTPQDTLGSTPTT